MKSIRMLALAAFSTVVLSAIPGSALATTLTSSGSTYTGQVTASSSGSVSFDPSAVTVSCFRSTMAFNVSTHGAGVTAGGAISSLTFTECNYPTTVNKAGSLEIHATSGGDGMVTWSGAQITIVTSVGTCVYTTNKAQFTFWGGSFPYFSTGATILQQTGKNFLCGSTATFTGTYRISSPFNLSVDA